MAKKPANDLLNVLSIVMTGLVADDAPDLTMRALSVLLVTNTGPGPHIVRDLADRLDISKAAVVRSVGRLVELGLVQRGVDPINRRSLRLGATKAGAAYVTKIGRLAKSAKG